MDKVVKDILWKKKLIMGQIAKIRRLNFSLYHL